MWELCENFVGLFVKCFALANRILLTLCSPSSTFGTTAHLPDLTFGTNTGAMHNDLNLFLSH